MFIQSLKQEYIEFEEEEYVEEMPNIHQKLYRLKVFDNLSGQKWCYIKK